ncbi:hypothetical protein H0H81_000995 [Sphagnurus paluster]|uniref:Uncharacterized protein n=1 Tax=Sphagnurus paluster TaxID=117069 RepID=A0A9P7K3A6_9AGAR|nr:hypothetical protein H0H81_000995 [Sphagnurus paluster]
MNRETAKTNVDAGAVTKLVSNVKDILSNAAVQIKALKGRPMAYILSEHGKPRTKAELCQILLSVINTICAILSAAFNVVENTSGWLIADTGVVFSKMLCATFTLVDGAYASIRPSLDSAINICTSLRMDTIMNGKYY